MAKAKKTEIKEKNMESLKEDLKAKREELFKIRLEHARGKVKNTTSMTTMRKDIARMLTAIKMHEEVAKAIKEKKEVTNG
jgi:large subunit ribosomal protein L29